MGSRKRSDRGSAPGSKDEEEEREDGGQDDPTADDHGGGAHGPGSRFGRQGRDLFDLFFPDIQGEFSRMRDLMDRMVSDRMGKTFEKPFVYGFSMRVGPDGKPHVQEFGHRPSRALRAAVGHESIGATPREPLTDVVDRGKHVSITVEMPGVEREDVQLEVGTRTVVVSVEKADQRYHKEIELPCEVKPESATASCKNGILDLTIEKKKDGVSRRRVSVG